MASRICPKCQQVVDSDEPFCPRDGTRLLTRSVYEQMSAETDPLVGQRIAERFLVIRKLGEGGMGDVFLGEHEEIEKRVALKVLKQEYSVRPDVVARFKQEAISASRIKHPNVVDVFDFGQLDDGRFFLAMELLEGTDLADLLASTGVIEPGRGLRVALQMCRALTAAHGKGVVHRDLKPENVFLVKTEDGDDLVKIVDFGIAKLRDVSEDGEGKGERRKLTKTGMIFGTPEYMAPEQAAGRQVDDKVDVYATGIILFEMFAGRVPFYGDTFMAVLTAHMTDPVPNIREVNPSCAISRELEAAILRALSKKPTERFQSMAAFAEALTDSPEGRADPTLRMSRLPSPGDGIPILRQNTSSVVAAQTGEQATSSTQLTVSTSTASPGRGKLMAGLGIAALVVAGLSFVGYRVTRSTAATPTATADPIPTPSVTAGASVSVPTAPAVSSSMIAVEDPGNSVIIHIVTKPDGAVVKKKEGDSLFQVCAAAPCDYPAKPDEKVELVAEMPGMRGSAAVLARTSQTLEIELKKAGAGGTRPPPTSGGSRTNMCEFCVPRGDPDCIKVIRPCNQPP
jgi:serine/threonine-protein kinase